LFEEKKAKESSIFSFFFKAFLIKQPNNGEEEIKKTPSKWERINRELLGCVYVHANRLHHCSMQLKWQLKIIRKKERKKEPSIQKHDQNVNPKKRTKQ
jgi:hypothetical protein